jgi:hypothetical protein
MSRLKTDLNAEQLKLWYHDGGKTAFLYACINPGKEEQWLELFWSID